MGDTKTKGDLGVGIVIAESLKRGHKVALPMGENWPFDIIVQRHGKLERVQCKYTESDGEVIEVRCRSTSEWVQYKYTADMIDWIACYDKTTDRCYFVPATLLGDGKSMLHLRLVPSKNGQTKHVRMAEDFLNW